MRLRIFEDERFKISRVKFKIRVRSFDGFVRSRVALQRQPPSASENMKPSLGCYSFRVAAHKCAIDVARVWIGDRFRHSRNFTIYKFLDRSFAAMWARDYHREIRCLEFWCASLIT